MPSSGPHSPTFSMSPRYRTHDGDTEASLYGFAVIREEIRCRWRLPLWLLFFGGTVSILTLLYLLTGTVYPAANPWMRFTGSSHSLGVLKAVKGIYHPGHQLSVIHDSAAHPSVHVSYVEPSHVFKRIAKSGSEDIITPSAASMRRPSTSGPASLVDSTTSLLVQVRVPTTSRDAQCMITSGITLTRHLETAGKVARVQVWSLTETTPDVGAWDVTWKYRSQRGEYVWSFDVRPGDVLRSLEFACPPSQSLQTFEVSCVDGGDACSVEVWQGLFQVEIRT